MREGRNQFSSPQMRHFDMLLCRMKLRLFLAASLAFANAGCVRYTPEPLVPEQSAADLTDRGLGGGTWDRARLTAAALKMQPELEVARAKLASTQAAMITAGARPNPSFGFS